MHARRRWRGRRTEEDTVQRRAIQTGCGTQKNLAQVNRAAADVSSDQVRNVPFHVRRSHDRPRGDAILEAGSETFHLVFNRLGRVAGKSVGHMAVTPRRVLPCRSAGAIKQAGLSKENIRTVRNLALPWLPFRLAD